jgi:hypothetical protein
MPLNAESEQVIFVAVRESKKGRGMNGKGIKTGAGV